MVVDKDGRRRRRRRRRRRDIESKTKPHKKMWGKNSWNTFKTISFYTLFVPVKSFLTSFGHGPGEILKKTQKSNNTKK